MSILSMPSTTDDAILDCLSAAELFKYGRTCKTIHSTVQSYLPRAFKLHKLLAPYFTPEQVVHFRKLQASTGMLISGSTALQFFDRVVYPESDLDLYVKHAHREAIGRWLLEIGYKYVALQQHVGIETFEDALALQPIPQECNPSIGHDFLQIGGDGYISRSSCIFTFTKKNPYQKIELISSLLSPLERILSFHSTCVMNIIAHDKAYSLFPRGTFEQRRSLVCSRPTADEPAHIKYMNRGWTIIYSLPREEVDDPRSPFVRGTRYIGDSGCWTLPVFPKLDEDSIPAHIGSVEANSWAIECNKILRPKMAYNFINSERLLSTYIIANFTNDNHLSRHIAEVLDRGPATSNAQGEAQPPNTPLDRQFTDLIKWYREEHDDADRDTCPLSTAQISNRALATLLRNMLSLS